MSKVNSPYRVIVRNDRVLLVPNKVLAKQQEALKKTVILPKYDSLLGNYVHSYRKGRSIVTCALPHCAKEGYLMHLDIAHFFDSIKTHPHLTSAFNLLGVSDYETAENYARLCSYNGCLPQGTVCSNELSNVAFTGLDKLINEIALDNELIYTRYSDDMFFSQESANRHIMTYVETKVTKLLSAHGYEVNPNKTLVSKQSKRKMVLGLIVNGSNPTLPGEHLKYVRQLLYDYNEYLKTNDLNVQSAEYYNVRTAFHRIRLVMPEYAKRLQDLYTWLPSKEEK